MPAWRVHLGMPMCGARMVEGRVEAILELARKDALLAFLAPFVHQGAEELPAAPRDQLPVDDEPTGVLGGSLGAAVALEVLSTRRAAIKAAALISPAVRMRSVVGLVGAGSGQPYPWTVESRRTADELDFVARAADVTAQPPLLLVSGELDHPVLRTDAAALLEALRERYTHPDQVELRTVPNLAHPLADEPGLAPAPQLTTAKAVDEILTQWFLRRFITT